MDDFLFILKDIFSIFGYLIRIAGFLLIGLGLGRFFLEAYPKSNWQLQMALTLGLFGLLIALTVFSSAGTPTACSSLKARECRTSSGSWAPPASRTSSPSTPSTARAP